MTLGDLLVKIVDVLFKGFDSYKSLKRDQLIRISDYLLGIAEALSGAASRLEQTALPPDECAELTFHLTHLKAVIDPLKQMSALDAKVIDLLYDQLSAAIEAPIKVVGLLESSRWAIIGNFEDAGAPVYVGKVLHSGVEIPAVLSTGSDLPEQLRDLSKMSAFTITLDLKAAMNTELNKIREAAGRFRGAAKTLRAIT